MNDVTSHDKERRARKGRTVPDDRFAWAAVTIFATALVVRLVHVWQLRAAPFFSLLMGDSHGYDEWAHRIAGGDWFGHEVFYQAPLYPYLLGVIYAIAGRNLLVVRIIQAIIGSASCALLGLAASRLFSRRVGIAAGLMLALYAPAIFFDGLLQKSVLDVFFVCLALWLMSKALTVRSPRSLRLTWTWFWLGLAMGGLSLTRENALVFIAVILVWTLSGVGRASPVDPPADRVKAVGVFLLGLAIVLVPVAARNSIVGGGFYITTSQFGPNFYIGNNSRSDGTYQSLRFGRGAPEYERQDATELAEYALGRRLSPAEVSGYWTDKALDFITSHPGAWLTLMGKKVALLWNASEMLDTESQETHAEWSLALRLLSPIGNFGVLVPLALFGVIVTWSAGFAGSAVSTGRRRPRLLAIYAMALAYAASVVLFYVFARYRYPLVPFLMMFAAAGLIEAPMFLRALTRRAGLRGNASWTLAAVAGVAVFTNWPLLSTETMRAVTETNLGVAFQAESRFDEATDHYRRAIALKPDYAPAYNNMATALRAHGQLSDAVAAYEQALALRPDYPEVHYNLANALLDEGKADEAVEHFQRALQSIPGSVDVHNNLGIALAGKGEVARAIAEFRTALQMDPDSAKTHRNLGDTLASAGRPDEAIDHLRRAAQLDPGDAAARYDLGSLFLEMHRLDEAVTEFRAALTLTPDSVRAHNNLGIALGSQGNLDAAIDQFQQALKLQPGFADAQRNLETALRARGRQP